jgi:hypothetical protein
LPWQQLPQPSEQQLPQPSGQQVLQQAAFNCAVWLKATAVKARTSERIAMVRFMDISFDVENDGFKPCQGANSAMAASFARTSGGDQMRKTWKRM